MSAPLCRYEGEACGIEKEALMLQADLGSGNLSKTRATLKQLKQLAGMLGRVGSDAGKAQSTINSAISKAQRQIDQLEMEESAKDNKADAQEQFEILVYGTMSATAKKFYDGIDANTLYTIAPVGDKGAVVQQAAKTIDGKSLKRLVSLIKFHSMDTDHKKKILYATFGADAVEGEGTPKDKELLLKKKQELLELHEALDDMEAYKALMISHKYKADIAAAMIKKNHKIIAAAHAQIDEVSKKYDDLIRDVDNGMAMAILKAAKLKMKTMLKENVIDHVLLDQELAATSISGGVHVAQAIHSTGRSFAEILDEKTLQLLQYNSQG